MIDAAISRRIFLNTTALAAAGLALSGCGRNDEIEIELADDAAFEFFDTDRVNTLLDVADLLIPRTDTVGALDTGTVLYLDRLMTTWAGASTKSEILAFFHLLDRQAAEAQQSRYLDLSKASRFDTLSEIDRSSFSESETTEIAATYRRIKWLVFHIHYTSEETNSDFVLIPGQYRGNVSKAEYSALVEDNRY